MGCFEDLMDFRDAVEREERERRYRRTGVGMEFSGERGTTNAVIDRQGCINDRAARMGDQKSPGESSSSLGVKSQSEFAGRGGGFG